jgi:hypothetical protein
MICDLPPPEVGHGDHPGQLTPVDVSHHRHRLPNVFAARCASHVDTPSRSASTRPIRRALMRPVGDVALAVSAISSSTRLSAAAMALSERSILVMHLSRCTVQDLRFRANDLLCLPPIN